MTKLRTPDSLEDACTQAKALLGGETISLALSSINLRASASLIDKWCDGDAPQVPSTPQSIAIEKLLVRSGHDNVFRPLYPTADGGLLQATVDPVEGAMKATIAAAELMKGVREAVQDGQLQVHEVSGLKARLQRLQRELADLNRSLVVKRRQ